MAGSGLLNMTWTPLPSARVRSSSFRVKGLGFRVKGLGLRASLPYGGFSKLGVLFFLGGWEGGG